MEYDLGNDVVVKVDGVSKKFCSNLKRSMFYGLTDVTRTMLGMPYGHQNLRKDEFWAVKDISFELKRGEALGIIGQNGSGKSTLLRLIHGIFPPDKGRIAIRGRMGALIAIGAGFHPHMTGRENIYLNGTILGMTKREITQKLDEIIDFAEVDGFIDAPVSTYSSGMYVRLGFAIAISAVPDVLLVDEVLAVGDVNFQKKCFERIISMRRNGVSILFVSHSIQILESICQRGLLMDHGRFVCYDTIRETVKRYMDVMDEQNRVKANLKVPERGTTIGVGNVTFSNVLVYEEGKDKEIADIEFGKNIVVEFDYSFREKPSDDYQIRIGFKTAEGLNVQKFFVQESPFTDQVVYGNEKFVHLGKSGRATIKIVSPMLFPQTFTLDIAIKSLRMNVHEGGISQAYAFRVIEPKEDKMYFEYGHISITNFDYQIEIEN